MKGIKKSYHIFGILLLYLSGTAYGQGTVVDDSFFSSALDTTRFVDVYLPEGYDPDDSTVKYPVIYFLHGAGGNQDGYGFILGILDALIGNQTIEPVIVVKPDGSIAPYEGSMYTNSELYGQFEDYIVKDLIDFIDTHYNTIATPDKRCIMGHSMGAYGAMKLALKHPEIYRCVAAHSGPLDLNHGPDWFPNILAENGGAPPYSYTPGAGTFSILTFTAAGAFSPNLNNPPYFVDFPLDTSGNLIDSIFAKWVLHNPSDLAAEVPADADLAIYFDCGMQDELLIFPFNTGFADSLNQFGMAYEFQAYTGNHSNQLANRFPISLAFLDSVMKSTPVGITNEELNIPQSLVLHQNYPNPFNPNTTIEFSLPRSATVTLKVYNTLGQEVANLISEKLPLGNHKYEWNANGLASGAYYYRLHVGLFVQTKKLVLLR